jgi:hypothetical protein
MARKDSFSDHKVAATIVPAVQSASANGASIDLVGFNSVLFAINTGAIASAGDFGVKIQHSNTSTSADFVDAPVTAVRGTVPATLAADSAYRLGYTGGKRFARLALVKAGGTSIALGAVAVLGEPAIAPVA